MKQIVTLFIFVMLFNMKAFAQIPNAGFEKGLNIDSTIPNWTSFGTISIGMNDSFLNDGPLVSLSTFANSGSYALELRTYYNVTQNKAYELELGCDSSSTFFAFPVFHINLKPTGLSFYYSIKEFPTTPFIDTTLCTVKIMNSDFETIGSGSVKVWTKNQWYLFKGFPINYLPLADITQGDSIPAFAHISFKHLISTITPHVGHRILIDDLSFSLAEPTSVPTFYANNKTVLFPNPVEDILHIQGNEIVQLELINAIGQRVLLTKNSNTLLVSHLVNGSYFLKITYPNRVETQMIQKN